MCLNTYIMFRFYSICLAYIYIRICVCKTFIDILVHMDVHTIIYIDGDSLNILKPGPR